MSDSGEAVPGAPAAPDVAAEPAAPRVPLGTVLREWGRIGCIGFGGPPTHIKLLRELCMQRKGWLDGQEFEDAIAVCNLLPGPARPRPSWPSSARGGCAAGSGHSSAVPRSSSRA